VFRARRIDGYGQTSFQLCPSSNVSARFARRMTLGGITFLTHSRAAARDRMQCEARQVKGRVLQHLLNGRLRELLAHLAQLGSSVCREHTVHRAGRLQVVSEQRLARQPPPHVTCKLQRIDLPSIPPTSIGGCWMDALALAGGRRCAWPTGSASTRAAVKKQAWCMFRQQLTGTLAHWPGGQTG
jgi:hypothetical protein